MWKYLLYAFVFFAIGNAAQAQTVARGVICNSKEQVVLFYTYVGDEKMAAPAALERVNAETKDENGCGFLVAVVIEPEPVGALKVGQFHLTVVKLKVVAVMTPQGPMGVEPLEQFMAILTPGAEQKKGRDA